VSRASDESGACLAGQISGDHEYLAIIGPLTRCTLSAVGDSGSRARDQNNGGGNVGDSPSLLGRTVLLRPLTPADYNFMHLAETSSELGPRWRFRGSTPSPERWNHETWSQCLAAFLVIRRSDDVPVGYVAVHQANFQDGHAHLSATKLVPEGPVPALSLGLALFLRYVFSCWNLRKLYMDVPEYNYGQFASGLEDIFVMEGRLRDDLFAEGRYWDQIILAIYRDSWLNGRAGRALAYEDASLE